MFHFDCSHSSNLQKTRPPGLSVFHPLSRSSKRLCCDITAFLSVSHSGPNKIAVSTITVPNPGSTHCLRHHSVLSTVIVSPFRPQFPRRRNLKKPLRTSQHSAPPLQHCSVPSRKHISSTSSHHDTTSRKTLIVWAIPPNPTLPPQCSGIPP